MSFCSFDTSLPAWAKDSFKTKVSLKLFYFWFTFLGPTPDTNRNSTPSKITVVLILHNRPPEISRNRVNVFVYLFFILFIYLFIYLLVFLKYICKYTIVPAQLCSIIMHTPPLNQQKNNNKKQFA